jgi:UDP-GlcNAc:undecaprenyl-phosphate GlcNAc-1-phosphate transferase
MLSNLHSSASIVTLACVAIGAGLTTLAIEKLARRAQVLSHGGFRRNNEERIPLLGGLSIYLSLCVLALFSGNYTLNILVLAAIPLVFVGIVDDAMEISARYKYLAHLTSGALWIWFTGPENILFGQMEWPMVVTCFAAMIWLTGIPSAMNFIDGIDGQASLVAILAATTLAYLSLQFENELVGFAIAAATLGFFVRNAPPAKIYLGDVGSSFLGFALATLSLRLTTVESGLPEVFGFLFALSFPAADLVLATLRRTLKGASPLQGDRDHVHHKLMKIGFSRQQTLMVTGSATLYTCVTALALASITTPVAFVAVVFLSAVAMLSLLGAIFYLEHQLGKQLSKYGQPLLVRHILSHNPQIIIDSMKFRAILFDLLPYYKELQYRGFPIVDAFIKDFASFVDNKAQFKTSVLGSYSVILYANDAGAWDVKSKKQISAQFKDVLEKYKIVKSAEEIPDGVFFYSTLEDPQAVLRIVSSYQEQASEQKQAA